MTRSCKTATELGKDKDEVCGVCVGWETAELGQAGSAREHAGSECISKAELYTI